jgi:tight adherence protein C
MFNLSHRPARAARLLPLAPLLALIALLLPLAAASAQTAGQSMTLNQARAYGWPTVTLNFNLRSLDSAGLGAVQAGQFVVEENGQPQQIQSVALGSATGAPLAVVLVLDTSGSMQGAKLQAAQAAANGFLTALAPQDEVALVAFSTKVTTTTFTTDKARITTALNAQAAKGNTAIYDALSMAADLAATSPAATRRAIVLLTDGKDTSSTKAPLVGTSVARQNDTLVFTIGVGGDTDDKVLASLSEPTGGRYLKAADPAALAGIYQDLARELNGQFLLTYTSTTHIVKNYETVGVRLIYTTPNGQKLTQEVRYRPPAAALVGPTPGPTATAAPVLSGAVPPGLFRRETNAVSAPTPGPAPAAGNSGAVRALSLMAGMLAALAVLLGIGALTFAAAPPAVKGRIDRFVAERGGEPPVLGGPKAGFVNRVLLPLFARIGAQLGSLTPASYLEQIQSLIYQAGPPYRMTRAMFLGMQAGISMTAGLLMLLWAYVGSPHAPLTWLLALAVGLFAGIYLPYFFLVRRVTQRKGEILRAMPPALDFLAIMVEAGMGFDTALTELARRAHNPLTDEFALLLIDFQIGKPRRDAWRELSLRAQVPDLNAFVVAMVQSEQTGISIGDLLRTQSDQIRIRRRQRAEELARMAPVKMLIPMALFIFPVILMMILGPALPVLFQSLGNLTK